MRGGASETVSELCIPESECASGSIDPRSESGHLGSAAYQTCMQRQKIYYLELARYVLHRCRCVASCGSCPDRLRGCMLGTTLGLQDLPFAARYLTLGCILRDIGQCGSQLGIIRYAVLGVLNRLAGSSARDPLREVNLHGLAREWAQIVALVQGVDTQELPRVFWRG